MLYWAYMYRGRGVSTAKSSGFTVVETLIFLVVSLAMFVSAMLLVGGMQNKTEFINAVRDFEATFADTANDVGSGYYQGPGSLPTCNNNSGVPTFTGGTVQQGMNLDCIFIGKVIKADSNTEKYNVYSLVGVRKNSSQKDVTTLVEAMPRLITSPETIATSTVGAGAKIKCIRVDSSPNCDDTMAVAFVSNLSRGAFGFTATGDSGTGIRSALYTYNLDNLSELELEAKIRDQVYSPASFMSPATVQIYISSGTTNQCGVITLGSNSSSGLSVKSEIQQGVCT